MNADIFRAIKQLAFVAAISTLVLYVEGCNATTSTRYLVSEHAVRDDGSVTNTVARNYVATRIPARHGDFLVFEDSASRLLVRVRFNRAVLSYR
jgi:hypothetical protein